MKKALINIKKLSIPVQLVATTTEFKLLSISLYFKTSRLAKVSKPKLSDKLNGLTRNILSISIKLDGSLEKSKWDD